MNLHLTLTKAINAISNGLFKKEIVPITVTESYLDENEKKIKRDYIIDTDEEQEKIQQLKNYQN